MSLVEQALKKMQSNVKSAVAPIATATTRSHADAAAGDPTSPRAAASFPPARVVPFNAAHLRSVGLLPPEHQERRIAQQYRQIKRPLITSALGTGAAALPNGHLIMVASAMPGEGKTFTSINLALSIAREKDLRVLLVDADVAKPHLSRLFGVADEPGLLDLVRDPSLDPERLILPTDVPSLSILPAGRQSENATELLASARMHELARAIGSRDLKRIALFDSPPLILTTESHALAQVAGQVVVVVRAGVTPQQVLLDAVRLIGDRPVGFVLNQCVSDESAGYYNYGYGDSQQGTPA